MSAAGQGKTIAVLDFPALNNSLTELGAYVSEEISTALASALQGKGRVVERRQVLQILEEERLAVSGLTASQIAQVAKKLGADAVVIGSLTVLGSQVVVNARLVEVSTGAMLSAQRISGTGSQEVIALADRRLSVSSQPTSTAPTPSPQTSRGGPSQTGLAVPSEAAGFETDYFRVRSNGAAVSENVKTASISFTIENKTNTEQYVAMIANQAALTDSRANTWFFAFQQTSGMVEVTCIVSSCDSKPEVFTRIGPGSRMTEVLSFFSAENGRSRPQTISFSMKCVRRRIEGGFEPFAIGLANVPVDR